MKKIIATALLCSVVSAPAFAGSSPIYAGVMFGSTTVSSYNSMTSTGVYVGYKLDQVLSVEGQYTKLGDVAAYSISNSSGTLDSKISLSSIGVNVVGTFPTKVVENLSVFGKLGFAKSNASLSCSGTGVYARVSCPAYSAATSSLVYGLGAQYDVTKEIGVRAGYQTYASDTSSLYVSAQYNF